VAELILASEEGLSLL